MNIQLTEAERILAARKSVAERLIALAQEVEDDEETWDEETYEAIEAARHQVMLMVEQAEASVDAGVEAIVDSADDYQRARDWEPR